MAARKYPPWAERFFALVKKTDDCWEWQGGKNSHGYGMTKNGGEMFRAHRVSYQLAFGAIPNGKFVLHSCDNRGCVNPDHLFLGTQTDNMQDMYNKGRNRNRTQCKLTPENAYAILWRKVSGEKTSCLASEYDVSQRTVRDIARKTWQSLSVSHD